MYTQPLLASPLQQELLAVLILQELLVVVVQQEAAVVLLEFQLMAAVNLLDFQLTGWGLYQRGGRRQILPDVQLVELELQLRAIVNQTGQELSL